MKEPKLPFLAINVAFYNPVRSYLTNNFILQEMVFHCKAFKLQSYISVTLNLSVKPPNSEVKLNVKPQKIKFGSTKNLSDLVIKLVNPMVSERISWIIS